jgi:large conductance mechanosensitive channel
MFKEFRDFAMKGNALDLAIAVVVGAAFSKIVDSLVGDIIMPIVGAITGGVDFSNYFFPLSKAVTATTLAEARKQGAVLALGNFITIVVNFLIVAWAMFVVVKAINQLKQPKAEPSAPPPPPRQEVLLQEIRDALVKRPGP